MVNKYKLVNPYIKGDFETKIDAKNSLEAAKILYKNLSEHFNNNVPSFYFTIQKGGSGKGKFSHFQVNERKTEDEVSYSLKSYELKDEDNAIAQYVENFEKFKGRFNGGGKKTGRKSYRKSSRKSGKKSSRKSKKSNWDDSDSDSDSDSYNFYREAKSYIPVTNQSLYYMYYDPLVYRLDSVYLPTFYPSSIPYLEYASYAFAYY